MGLYIIHQKKAPQTRLETNPSITYWDKLDSHPSPKTRSQASLLTSLKFPVVPTTQITALKELESMKRKRE